MIAYKYKVYRSRKNKILENMLLEAAYVWNHALSIHKRYYSLYGKHLRCGKIKAHFAKRIKRGLLNSQTVQEILERLDASYIAFFERKAKRPPKFRKPKWFSSITFKQCGYSLHDNVLRVNRAKACFKFALSRPYGENPSRIIIKKNRSGDFYVIMVFSGSVNTIRKTHNGASVGIDFGLKRYLSLSDGGFVYHPQFHRAYASKLHWASRALGRSVNGSSNKERKRKVLSSLIEGLDSKRNDFQWKLAHELCRKYDVILLENLNLSGMTKLWGKKMNDLAHGEFVNKLKHVAKRYGVIVHEVGRFFPSSRLCECGYRNDRLTLSDRTWTCPVCGVTHDRDLLAAKNILRQGIVELRSICKTWGSESELAHVRLNSTILPEIGMEYVKFAANG